MGRGTSNKRQHPEFGRALKYLRKRAQLTQEQLAERVTASGTSLSKVYLSQCERSRKYPSPEMSEALLQALGSSEMEMGQLLREQPWWNKPPEPPIMSPLPEPSAAPAESLASETRGFELPAVETLGSFLADSGEIAMPAAAPVGSVFDLKSISSTSLNQQASSPLRLRSANRSISNLQASVDTRAKAASEEAQLLDDFRTLEPQQRQQLLGYVRALRDKPR